MGAEQLILAEKRRTNKMPPQTEAFGDTAHECEAAGWLGCSSEETGA